MMVMLSVTECDSCGGTVTLGDVTRHAAIPSAMGYVGVLWTCGVCQHHGKTALRVSQWQDIQQSANVAAKVAEDVVAAARIEIDAVDDVGDLLALWASYPGGPIMEVPPHARCPCKFCRRKYGPAGQESS